MIGQLVNNKPKYCYGHLFIFFVLPIFFGNKSGLEDEIKKIIKFFRPIFQLN